jgi:hypothetical protein
MIATKRQSVAACLLAAISFVAGAAISSTRIQGQSRVPDAQSKTVEARPRRWEYRVVPTNARDQFKEGEQLANSLGELGFELDFVGFPNEAHSLMLVFKRPKPD